MASTVCFDPGCGQTIEADDEATFEEEFLAHIRERHPELPFPDNAVRNYAAATQRLATETDRRPEIGPLEVHPVTEDRIADWLELFDHTGFAGNPPWASCYCTEPHLLHPDGSYDPPGEDPRWQERREAMLTMLGNGIAFGYLAYAGGDVAGWVNASLRSNQALHRRGEGADVPDPRVVAVSCFVIAPPFRRHGVAATLLDRVISDAAGRGATHVEGYPFKPKDPQPGLPPDAGEYRGPRAMFEERGFEEVAERERDWVMRLLVG